MKHGVDELLVELVRLAGVKEGVVDVGRPVVKGREEEAQLRRADHLSHGVVELIVAGEIPQLRPARLHRADAADNIGEHLV